MSVRSRVFGSDIDTNIKKKLNYRQAQASQGPFKPRFASPSDIYSEAMDNPYMDPNIPIQTTSDPNDPNVSMGAGRMGLLGTPDLATRTPWVRMWTAVQIYKPEIYQDEIFESDLLSGYDIASNLDDYYFDSTHRRSQRARQLRYDMTIPPNQSVNTQDENFFNEMKAFHKGDDVTVEKVDGAPGLVRVKQRITKLKSYESAIYELGNHQLIQDRVDSTSFIPMTGVRGTNQQLSEFAEAKGIPIAIGNNTEENSDFDPLKNLQSTSTNVNFTAAQVLPMEFETNSNEFLRPPAGITSVSSTTEGPLGSRKRTTVNFLVHNWHDFENIFSRYFLKPGAQVYVDMGWSTSLLYSPYQVIGDGDAVKSDNVLSSILNQSDGELETIIGHVVNYDAKILKNGSVQCMVEIVSKNSAVLGFDIFPHVKSAVAGSLEAEFTQFAADFFSDELSSHIASADWQTEITSSKDWLTAFRQFQPTYLHGLHSDVQEQTFLIPGKVNRQTGVMWGGISLNQETWGEGNRLYINWGLFEDKVLNPQFGHSGKLADMHNGHFQGAGFDSTYSFVRWNEDLFKRQAYHDAGNKELSFVMPFTWESSMTFRGFSDPPQSQAEWVESLQPGYTPQPPTGSASPNSSYNSARNKVPDAWRYVEMYKDLYHLDQRTFNIRELFSEKVAGGIRDVRSDYVRLKENDDLCNKWSHLVVYNATTSTGPAFVSADNPTLENAAISDTLWDKEHNRIPFREIFISVNLISEAFAASNNVTNLLKYILDRLNGDAHNVWDLQLYHSGRDNTISICDRNLPIIDDGSIFAEDYFKNLFEFNPNSPTSVVKDYDLHLQMPQDNIGSWVAINNMDPNQKMQVFSTVIDAAISNEMIEKFWDEDIQPGSTDETIRGAIQEYGLRYLPHMGSYAAHRLNVAQSEAVGYDLAFTDLDEKQFFEGKVERRGNSLQFDDRLGAYHQDGLLDTLHSIELESLTKKDKYRESAQGEGLDDEDLIEAHAVAARAKGYLVAGNIQDYYNLKAQSSVLSEQIPTILPIKCSISIYGISGIIPGDTFRVDYIPAKHRRYTFFQALKVSHDISNTWTTTIEAVMRIRSSEKKACIDRPSSPSWGSPTIVLHKKCLMYENSTKFGITKGFDVGGPGQFEDDKGPSVSYWATTSLGQNINEYGTFGKREGFLGMIRDVEPADFFVPGKYKFISAIYKFRVNEYSTKQNVGHAGAGYNEKVEPWRVHVPVYNNSTGFNPRSLEKLWSTLGDARSVLNQNAPGKTLSAKLSKAWNQLFGHNLNEYGYSAGSVRKYYVEKQKNYSWAGGQYKGSEHLWQPLSDHAMTTAQRTIRFTLYPNEEWYLVVNGGSPGNPWTLIPSISTANSSQTDQYTSLHNYKWGTPAEQTKLLDVWVGDMDFFKKWRSQDWNSILEGDVIDEVALRDLFNLYLDPESID